MQFKCKKYMENYINQALIIRIHFWIIFTQTNIFVYFLNNTEIVISNIILIISVTTIINNIIDINNV